jgi:hypothetical protein
MTKANTAAVKLDQLERIEGIAAIPPGAEAVSAHASKGGATHQAKGLRQADIQAFEDAGWSFVSARSAPARDGTRPVFRDEDGQVKIDSGALNVRFAGKPSQAEINRLLEQHGLLVKRQLGFAPNLYTVVPIEPSQALDSVATAKSLTALEQVEYAEPILIEGMSGRRLLGP